MAAGIPGPYLHAAIAYPHGDIVRQMLWNIGIGLEEVHERRGAFDADTSEDRCSASSECHDRAKCCRIVRVKPCAAQRWVTRRDEIVS